jgi:hypothetical protein
MKAKQLATLVLRLLGIYWLIQIIPIIALASGLIFSMPQNPNESRAPEVLIGCIVWVACCLVGVLLLVRSESWSEKLVPKGTTETSGTAVSFEQIQVLTFAAAGILVLAGALPQLFNSIYSIFIWLHQNPDKNPYLNNSFSNNPRLILSAAGTLLKAALGLWLFFGAHGFANFWRSLRNFGTPKPPEN